MKICFATNNKNKIKELRVLAGEKHEILSLSDISCFDELPETKDTLAGNSEQKARFIFENYGVACFADDTGLLVEALNQAPGVYSARYAGPECDSEKNMQKLLFEMQDVENRKAKFQTVITYIDKKGVATAFEGEIKGTIAKKKSGTDGFGYDPLFIPENQTKSFSEMSMNEKNSVSHRARAVKKLIEFLNTL